MYADINNEIVSEVIDCRPVVESVGVDSVYSHTPDGIEMTNDGQRLYSGSSGDYLTEHDTQTGESLIRWRGNFNGHLDRNMISVTPDDEQMVVSDGSGELFILNTDGFGANWVEQYQSSTTAVSPTSDGAYLFIGESSNSFRKVDATTGEDVWTAKKNINSGVYAIEVGPNDDYVYVGNNNRIWKYDVVTGERVWSYFHDNGTTYALEVAPDNSVVYVGDNAGFVTRVGVDSGTSDWSTQHDTSRINSLVADTDSSGVYSAAESDNTVIRIGGTSGNADWTNTEHVNNVYAVDIGPQGDYVFSCDNDGNVQKIVTSNGSLEWMETSITGNSLRSLDVEADRVYVGDTTGRFAGMSAATGSVTWDFRFERNTIKDISVDPSDSNLLFYGTDSNRSGQLRVDDVATNIDGLYREHGGNWYSIDVHPDGEHFYSGYHNGNHHRVGKFELSDPRTVVSSIRVPSNHTAQGLRVSPDGEWVVFNGDNNNNLYRTDADLEEIEWSNLSIGIDGWESIDVSPDGTKILVDEYLIDAETGALIWRSQRDGFDDTYDGTHEINYTEPQFCKRDPETYFYCRHNETVEKRLVENGALVWASDFNSSSETVQGFFQSPSNPDKIYVGKETQMYVTDNSVREYTVTNDVERVSIRVAAPTEDNLTRDEYRQRRFLGDNIRINDLVVDKGEHYLHAGDVVTANGVLDVNGLVLNDGGIQ